MALRLARAGRAAHRRLLRHRPRAHRRRRARRVRDVPAGRRRDGDAGLEPHALPNGAPRRAAAAAPGRTAAAGRSSRCRSRTSSPSRASPVPGAGELHGLGVPVPRGGRRAPALPGPRLRDRHPGRAARAQRRGARAGARRRPARGRQHARRTRSATASRTASPRPATDLYPWVPEERYEVIVASLPETPVDPFQPGRRAPAGRLLGPRAARPGARASCPRRSRRRASRTSCSSRSPRRRGRSSCSPRTASRAASWTSGCSASRPGSPTSRAQIARVEELSDAYHVRIGDHDAMVAYLLEIRHAGTRDAAGFPLAAGGA